MPQEQIDEYINNRINRKSKVFYVHKVNMPTLELFLLVSTQWKIGGMGGFFGLDYCAIDIVIRRLELRCTPEIWRGLQTIETVVLPILNKKQD